MLKERIKQHYDQLTKHQRKIAKLMMNEPEVVALKSAKEIGNMTGTSETTVIRFCYSLKYDGYSSLQEEVRKTILSPSEKESPIKKFREMTEQSLEEDELISYTLEQDQFYLNKTLNSLEKEQIHQIIQSIIQADNVVVVGLRTSSAPANWLSQTLNIIKGSTFLYRGETEDTSYLLAKIKKGSLVITFSFPRYSDATISYAQTAKELGAKIISITDDELSPVGRISDHVLKVYTPSPSSIKGMPIIFSVLNVLISGIMTSNKEKVQKRIQYYNEISEKYQSFFRE
ncbi:MurR/RpiR family transcriptional regulator [Bacillus massilinigeriensis]|uniref:MurR/RpiR family transcriptional regulator n=1 Tax=Bacillus massilionigeriensis TaxID=1805475 RepID=UPI00096AE0F6|nr:MurR/RpiR family transcriptional regulator [Bacillus massilionigeriensis]